MPILDFSKTLKIWFGKKMPDGLIKRLNEQAELTHITLLTNNEIIMQLFHDDLLNTLNRNITIIDITEKLEDPGLSENEHRLMEIIRTLIKIGIEMEQPRAYGLASDIARWLPYFLKNNHETFKVYTDTDITYANTIQDMPEELRTLSEDEPGVFARMFTGTSFVNRVDFGFIQLPPKSPLPQKIVALYRNIFFQMSEEVLRALVQHDACGGIVQLRMWENTDDPEFAFMHAKNLSPETLCKLTCEFRYQNWLSNLNERTWQMPVDMQARLNKTPESISKVPTPSPSSSVPPSPNESFRKAPAATPSKLPHNLSSLLPFAPIVISAPPSPNHSQTKGASFFPATQTTPGSSDTQIIRTIPEQQ